MASLKAFPVIVHPFASPTPHSCAYERGGRSSRNALVYIGGLTSGPHTTLGLINTLLQYLNDTELGYSIWEFRMRSSYTGFGHSSLANDVEDIAALVKYLREQGKQKIVLLGSSTGCQDCMEYTDTVKYNAPEVDGYIMQAPVSDRETAGMLMLPEFYKTSLTLAVDMIACGNKDAIMPNDLVPGFFNSPITVYRWHSLISKNGDDDYFSSDLDNPRLATTFGRINKPMLILPSEKDEMVPSTVDKRLLLRRWVKASPADLISQLSDLVPGADHTLSANEAQQWLSERVIKFLLCLGNDSDAVFRECPT